MGMWSSEYEDYCPICKKETGFSAWNDNDDTGTHNNCVECETEFPIPKIEEGKPFFIDKTLYSWHTGNDDLIIIERYHDK